MEMSSSQPSHIIYEKEAAIEIDYNTLEEGKCAIIYAIQFYTFNSIYVFTFWPRVAVQDAYSEVFQGEFSFPE